MNARQAMLEIQRILRDNSFERYAPSKKWKLDFNRIQLYKTSKKIFKQKLNTWGKKYAFTILLDVSSSMWDITNKYSPLHSAYKTLRNIYKILWNFVKIDIILFSTLFIKMSWKEFMKYNTPQKFNKFLKDIQLRILYNEEKNVYNLICVKNKPYKNSLYNYEDLWWTTNEPPAFQYAVENLRKFNWKTWIISLCDWENNVSDLFREMYETIYKILRNDDNLELYVNWIPSKKYNPETLPEQVKEAEKYIDYILWVWLKTDTPKNNYPNFIKINEPEEIYEYIVKIMKYLIYLW